MSAASFCSGSIGLPGVPRVGAVRCYWALLRPRYGKASETGETGQPEPGLELDFVHFDPILDAHLSKQRGSVVGKGVLQFIHPYEREQARRDLLNAINADDLQGSVTRVRYARLSRIRTLMGCPPEENEFPFDAEQYVEDDEYIVEDLVLNWAADGLLLAFFHSIRDKDPVANNDPKRANEEWSNWCGTWYMGDEQIEALHRNISNFIPVAPLTHRPPVRVFQLHLLPPDHLPLASTQLIFSWPPPRPPGSLATHDGLYNATEYCDMMKHVDMDPSQLTAGPGELRTSCTTRYGAHHLVTTEGLHRTVASVFISYGKLIFACFQTIKAYELPKSQEEFSKRTWGEDVQQSLPPAVQDEPLATPPLHLSTQPSVHPPSLQHPSNLQNSFDWPQTQSAPVWQDSNSYPSVNPWETGFSMPNVGMPMSAHLPTPSAIPQSQDIASHSSQGAAAYPTPVSAGGYYYSEYSSSLSSGLTPTSTPQPTLHPPPVAPTKPTSETGSGNEGCAAKNGGKPSTRPLVKPPGDIERCIMCGTTQSPEWRKSESGVKDLCNACGLRLARQVAKREGRQKPRKKKEVSVTKDVSEKLLS
ncbi:uncharacterized protein L203_101412 [Cryptococcus depauperatus CBS 7841]|uniref:Uncharacterized protein n=1 Tax=Cryptococcus depauperatus CBS 7841 TaxID=1295531 RepID=A0A1E3ITL6_9TREE|nr:hypothetical protein L203_01229 [Cryptococcus depauperatus CBS 7841]